MKAPRNITHRILHSTLGSLGLALAMASSASAQEFYSEIDAIQETPPNGSTATGTATLTLDTAANTLTYNIVFSGLTSAELFAHIHGAADPGVPAGIKHVLPMGSPKIGTWNYMEADEADILGGRMYINIHSSMFSGGEIRGQICPAPIQYCQCDTASGPPCANDDADSGCRNSTGSGADLDFSGLPSVILDTLKLTATQVPPNQNGIFFMGPNQPAAAPFGDGLKCVGGQLFRYLPPQSSGATGTLTLGPGIVARSQSFALAGHIESGDTWNFQAWYRDPMGPCGTGFSVSEAVSASFTP